MGYIKNGVYYRNSKPDAHQQTDTTIAGIHEQFVLERQAEAHAHNLIQPYNRDGSPNQDFIDYFPDDAKNYGFIKEEGENEPEQQ